MERFRDQPVLLGPRHTLVGILTPGSEPLIPMKRPTVVIFNAGIVHRVGPNRLNVDLARALARTGSTVLRFDLSGIGDSAPRGDDLMPLESSLADIRAALDWLETTQDRQRFVLLGLCSGADHAILVAASDPRIAGLVLLDPSIPRTPRYFINRSGRRLSRLARSLYGALAGRAQGWLTQSEKTENTSELARDAEERGIEDTEVRALFHPAYRKSMETGIATLAVFTDGLEDQHNYREQLLDAFPDVPFEGKLQLEYYSGCDHTFTLEANRARLIREVVDWIEKIPSAQEPANGLTP